MLLLQLVNFAPLHDPFHNGDNAVSLTDAPRQVRSQDALISNPPHSRSLCVGSPLDRDQLLIYFSHSFDTLIDKGLDQLKH